MTDALRRLSNKPMAVWLVLLAAAGTFALTMGTRQTMGLFLSSLNTSTGLGVGSISLAFAFGQLWWGLTQSFAGARRADGGHHAPDSTRAAWAGDRHRQRHADHGLAGVVVPAGSVCSQGQPQPDGRTGSPAHARLFARRCTVPAAACWERGFLCAASKWRFWPRTCRVSLPRAGCRCSLVPGRWRIKSLLSLVYVSRALAVLVFLLVPKTGPAVLVFAAFMSLTFLFTVPPTAGLVVKFFGVTHMATLFGIVMLTHQMGGFLGAWLGGRVFEATDSYDWMWYLDIALAVGAALVHVPVREEKLPQRASVA